MRVRQWPTPRVWDLQLLLYHHVRMVIVANSFLNPAVVLTAGDFHQLRVAYTGKHPELTLMVCIVSIAEAITEAREIFTYGTTGDEKAIHDLKFRVDKLTEQLESHLARRREELETVKEDGSAITDITMKRAEILSAYGFGLSTHAMLLCLRRALDPYDPTVDDDVAQVCTYALIIAEDAKIYQPLGSLWVVAVLMAVWCATLVPGTKLEIEDMILHYRRTALGPIGVVPKKELEWMGRRMDLRECHPFELQPGLLA
jgi:hypothetical protein